MNKTKLIYLSIVALLTTTHHHQTKTGIVGTVIVVAGSAVAAIYLYNKLQESQKSDVDKGVEVVADVAKKGLNAAWDKAQEIANNKK